MYSPKVRLCGACGAYACMRRRGACMQVAPDGTVVGFWTDASGAHVQGVSSAYEREDGRLWMGNLGNGDYISYLQLSKPAAA
jgi:hypothetical protein